ncbi:unnamed protein product, partial [Litomosoides sigmodontis]
FYIFHEWLCLLLNRNLARRFSERRLLRPRLEVKYEVTIKKNFCNGAKDILSAYGGWEVKSRGASVAKSKEKAKIPEVISERREKSSGIFGDETDTIIDKVEYNNFKKELDFETLPSTNDFNRFMSLDYLSDPEDISKELRHFRTLPLIPAHLINIAFIGISFFISLLLFQRGFLLKRVELTSRSSCSDVASRNACWFPAQYQRIIIVLIDALRYDFVAPPQPQFNSSNKAYSGHFSTITRLLNDRRESAVLMHFRADAPTTTMQRLKALTTGSLPTFIDVGSNFAGTAILEDNWIDEILATNRNNLFDELKKSDWTVLIAHFLGVDHCGHKYGPNHPEMPKKLKEMNKILAEVVDVLDNDTLLLVMGDHGMTENGDHGGDEPLETDAALFMFAKNKLVFAEPPESVSQVDIVPTISLLLDSPIPYSNIGTLIDFTIVPKYRALAISSNAEQMMRYGRTVVAETQLPELDSLIRSFENNGNVENSVDYMRRLQELLRASWTEFNSNFMRIGFLSLLDTMLSVYDSLYTKNILFASLVFRSGLFFIEISVFLIGDDEYYMAILDFLLSFSLIIRLVQTARTLFSFTSTVWKIAVFCIAVAHASSFLSNSYIVFESSVIRFLTQTLVVIAFCESFSNRSHSNRHQPRSFLTILGNRFSWQRCLIFIAIILLLRLGILFEKCREEQGDACEATIFSQPFSHIPHSPTKIMRFILGIVVQIAAACMATRFLQNYPSEIWTSTFIFPTTVATIALWLSFWLPEDTFSHFAQFSLGAAQIVYGLSLINLLIICFHAAHIGMFWSGSGCAISYLMCISSVLFLILGDGLAFSFLSLIIIMFLIPFVIDDEYYQTVFLVFLSSYGFFSLSHQPTFSSIPWQAAFVGVPGNFAIQMVPGALVVAHIFASQIITSVALPMLVVRQNCRQDGLSHWTYKLILFHSLKALAVCAMAVVHRRHLMVWKIFAPKFIFESLSLCVICFTLLITNCIFWKLVIPPPFDLAEKKG